MVVKISEAQLSALSRIKHWSNGGVGKNDATYMPYSNEQRSFDACERKGLVIYRSVSEGYTYNGYQLTDAGSNALDSNLTAKNNNG